MVLLTVAEDTYDKDNPEYAPLPADEVVKLEILSVTKKTMPWKKDDGTDDVKFEFAFKVVDGEYKGRRLWGQTSTILSTNENCKLRNWTQEILGIELPKDFQFDTDDLVGLEVRGVVAQRVAKKGTPDEKTVNYVSDLLRLPENMRSDPLQDEEPF